MNIQDLKALSRYADILACMIQDYNEYSAEAPKTQWNRVFVNSIADCLPSTKETLKKILIQTLEDLDKIDLKRIEKMPD